MTEDLYLGVDWSSGSWFGVAFDAAGFDHAGVFGEIGELWHRYEAGDDDALDRLVAYNRLDTENLRTVMEIVANRLHRATLGTAGPDQGRHSSR